MSKRPIKSQRRFNKAQPFTPIVVSLEEQLADQDDLCDFLGVPKGPECGDLSITHYKDAGVPPFSQVRIIINKLRPHSFDVPGIYVFIRKLLGAKREGYFWKSMKALPKPAKDFLNGPDSPLSEEDKDFFFNYWQV